MTKISIIRLNWMRKNIPQNSCKELSTIEKEYKEYIKTIKEEPEMQIPITPFSIKFPIDSELKYARDKIITAAHYHNDEFQVKKVGKRTCIIKV